MLVWAAAHGCCRALLPAASPCRSAGWLIAGAAAASVGAGSRRDVVAYGRQIRDFKGASYLYEGEGLNSSIAVSESEGGIRNFHVSGKVEASTEVHDMRLQRMLGHISALMHPDPHSVLIVGFGAGVDGRIVRPPPWHQAHRHLRDRAAHSAHGRARSSRRRTTTSCTTRVWRSSTTTRGITS
jgi:hypothetical protein